MLKNESIALAKHARDGFPPQERCGRVASLGSGFDIGRGSVGHISKIFEPVRESSAEVIGRNIKLSRSLRPCKNRPLHARYECRASRLRRYHDTQSLGIAPV